MDDQRKEVIANDNDIKRQVSGVTTQKEKSEPNSQNQNYELYFRALGYRQ
jgi:hypothetical protein